MQKVTTKAIAKVAAVAAGLAMATSMLSLAPMAQAAALTSAQVQSILSLLSSFGASSTVIANVQASLTGGTPSSTTTTTNSSSCSFTMSLTIGSRGSDVTCLQNALIAGGYSIPAGATGYFGGETKAAVIAWQKAAGVTPAAGYFGPISRAAFNLGGSSSTTTTTTTTTGGTTTVTGTGLKISLSPTSPNGTVLVAGQGIGDLGDFVFTNPTASPINVTGLTFNRTGISNDATLANVYLFNGGTRITDSAGVSAGQFSYSNAAGLFTVPAGGTYTVSVRSDIATGTSGQQIGVSLVSATSSGTLDPSVSFPIAGGYQTISAANLATVSYGQTVTPANNTTISPQSSYPVWQDTVSVSTNPVKLESMQFTNLGSIDPQYLTNLALYVDGVQVGSTIPAMTGQTVTFDLSASPVLLSEQSHVIKVLANVTGGAARTIQFSVQRSSDGMFVDSQLNQPVTPTSNGNNTFSAVNAGQVTINSVSGTSGVSVSLDPSSPNQNVAVGATSVNWATFDMLASGENTKVSDLYVYATDTGGGAGGLQNGKIMVNGVQVGSTKNIGDSLANDTDFSLGSSLILPAGQSTTVSIYADAKDTTGASLPNNSTVVVTLAAGSSNAQGQSSLQSANVPSVATSGYTISVTNSTLAATQYTGYGAQTIVPGTTNAKLGSFTLSTGSTEGVTVNTIDVTFTQSMTSTITNLTLKDDATGNTLGTIITTPSTSNSFAVNYDIPASSSKTIDVYGNVLSNAGLGTITASVGTGTTGSGDTTGTQASVGSAVALQNITLGAGSLAVSRGAGDPVSNLILAGASQVQVGQFSFAANNSAYTVQNLAILVPNGVATSVSNVTLNYTDVNGNTQTATQPLQVNSSMAYATAVFNGLTMYVPSNSTSNLNVFIGTPTIASGATSGAAINVSLDTANDTNFRAINSAGVPLTTVNSGVSIASGGTFYVHKSIPTFATIQPTSLTPSTGSPLYKFSISADPAGAIDWSHLVFNIATSSGVTVSNLYVANDSSGQNLLDNTNGAAPMGTFTVNLLNNSTQPTYQQVAAGSTQTYDLYGTVSGWPTGASLTVSLAADGSHAAENTAAGQTSGGANIVWSGLSASQHATSTSDWSNGYLLKNLTSTAVSYSH